LPPLVARGSEPWLGASDWRVRKSPWMHGRARPPSVEKDDDGSGTTGVDDLNSLSRHRAVRRPIGHGKQPCDFYWFQENLTPVSKSQATSGLWLP